MSQRALSGQSLSHVPPRRPCISPPRTRAASSVSARRVTRAAAGAGSAHGPGPLPRGPRSPPPPPPLPVECLPPPRGARSKAKAAPGRPRLERPGPAARQPLPQHSLSPSTGTRPLSILSDPANSHQRPGPAATRPRRFRYTLRYSLSPRPAPPAAGPAQGTESSQCVSKGVVQRVSAARSREACVASWVPTLADAGVIKRVSVAQDRQASTREHIRKCKYVNPSQTIICKSESADRRQIV